MTANASVIPETVLAAGELAKAPDGAPSGAPIDRILLAVRQHLGMEIAFVSRYVEDEQREFTHISTDLPLPHKPGMREHREESYCFHVLEGRLPGLIHDAADHPFAATLPITGLLPVGCHLNVPLRFSDGSVYGSFCALSRSPDRSISQRDMGILSAFAALAIEHIESNVGSELEQSHIRNKVNALLSARSMSIVHQPIFSMTTNEPVGVECLARFPDAGQRGPDTWFGEAASVGMGIELELLAVELALKSLGGLPRGMYASINASPATIMSGCLHDLITDDRRSQLVIEVTEHEQVSDYAALAAALRDLKKKARIAIDDVGAGYAGLRHIVDLSPDLLKLDMSLTRNVHADPARHALTGAMVRFAHEIGAKLVAEGVEHAAESKALAELGIDYGQGYHYARPMPVLHVQRLLMGIPPDPQDGAGLAVRRPSVAGAPPRRSA